MPRKQNIFEENPILQGAKVLTEGFSSFADTVTKARQDYVTFHTLQNIGKARQTPNFQSILEKVQFGLKQDEKATKEGIDTALGQAGKPGEVQNVNLAAYYDRMARDRKRAALADAAIQAEIGMQKEAQMATLSANLGAVGWMDANQQRALTMGLSGSMDGFNLTSVFDKMGLGGGGSGSGSGSGGGGSTGGHNWQKEWVDNGDGTSTLMMVDPKTGLTTPAYNSEGDAIVKISKAGVPSYDVDGPSAKATIPAEWASLPEEVRKQKIEGLIASYAKMGYKKVGDDGDSTLFFTKAGGGKAGGGKSKRDQMIDDHVGQLRTLKKQWLGHVGSGEKDKALGVAAQYNYIARRLREAIDPEHASNYPDLVRTNADPKPKKNAKAGADSAVGKRR